MSCTGLQNKASPHHTRACSRLLCSLQRASDKAMAKEMHWNMMWDGDCFALLSAIAPLQHTEEIPRNLGLPRTQTALIHSHSPHQTQDVGVKDSSQCISALRSEFLRWKARIVSVRGLQGNWENQTLQPQGATGPQGQQQGSSLPTSTWGQSSSGQGDQRDEEHKEMACSRRWDTALQHHWRPHTQPLIRATSTYLADH